ncbi:DNA recombination protein RmuC [Mycoplasma miroungirhinis]|uniref:DNA recombination protein RmuC n=1 Tax=Mycoplasma miroungirhinis TaxID=754516 RepID=A0A6M4JE81_9MOLU|nr:DNA recombination protein RmuC [Mycoplasma miroungirhinis]QJR44329.1 DNA recombination protein RmuC [Mycoplasma miroungirhinis]
MQLASIVLLIAVLISVVVTFLYVLWEIKNLKTKVLTQNDANDNDFKKDINNLNTQIDSLKSEILKNSGVLGEKISSNIDANDKFIKEISNNVSHWKETFNNQFSKLNTDFNEIKEKILKENAENVKQLEKDVLDKLEHLTKNFNVIIENGLKDINKTFDEKLSKDINEKLNTHFSTINKQMNELSKNLTQFETIQESVTSLNKTFTNVKLYGTVGEISLENILNEVFGVSTELVQKQFNINPKNDNKVDFAVKIFDKNNESLWLPIDSKFNLGLYRDYLNNPSENKKRLIDTIKTQAKSISEKYIVSQITLDYAIMYLPAESLHGFVYDNSELIDELWSKYKIIPVGPSAIIAALNSALLLYKQAQISKDAHKIIGYLEGIQNNFKNLYKNLESIKKYNIDSANKIDTAIKQANTFNKNVENILSKKIVQKIQKQTENLEENSDDFDQ